MGHLSNINVEQLKFLINEHRVDIETNRQLLEDIIYRIKNGTTFEGSAFNLSSTALMRIENADIKGSFLALERKLKIFEDALGDVVICQNIEKEIADLKEELKALMIAKDLEGIGNVKMQIASKQEELRNMQNNIASRLDKNK